MTIKTGCSASLAALHEAFRAIQVGDATGAIIGGTSLIMTPTTTAAFTSEGILSPDGSCKSFDASANGFARAEAINAIYIKPLAAALRDGNAIRAVIRATGANSDGHSQGLFTPNLVAQEALMRQVYREAGLDPAQTAYVEVTFPPAVGPDPEANLSSATEPVRRPVTRSRPRLWVMCFARRASTSARSSRTWAIQRALRVLTV